MAFIEPEEFRMEKLEELRRLGVDPYGGAFPDTRPLNELVEDFEELEGERVRAAGLITNKRDMGRASFMDIKDWTDSIQVFFQQKRLGEQKFAIHQQLDAGDIVGVEGELTKTRTGEKTIFVDEFTVLAKALLNPPEKWHGLRDQELRYRHRSLDLFTNDEVMEVFRARSRIIRVIREFLQEREFVEVETPMMQTVAGGAAARPFKTHHNALDIPLYLRIAPELYLKRLLVGGMEKVFEINRNFRNEGISSQHNPEFTMLEVYEAYGSYETMMELTQDLVARAAEDACGSLVLPWGEDEIDLTPPWPRRPFWELVEEHLDLARGDEEAIRDMAEETQTKGARTDHPDLLAYHLFEKRVEEQLQDPVFVIDYPKSISPLAKAKKDDPAVAERFELYMAGMELAPAYTELNDPLEQEQRFLEQVGTEEERQQIDREFVQALGWGMPSAGGLGIGIDRLVMILTNQQSIRDVILFPLLRPREGD
ncbi:MAG: lysine--tRNA ligase [Candidatus Brocadiia bacterium]